MTSSKSKTRRLDRQRAGPLRSMGPPRPVSLPERPPRGKLRTDSTHWRKIGERLRRPAHPMLGARQEFQFPPPFRIDGLTKCLLVQLLNPARLLIGQRGKFVFAGAL